MESGVPVSLFTTAELEAVWKLIFSNAKLLPQTVACKKEL